MNKLVIIPIVIGIIVAISAAAVSIENEPSVTETKPVYDSGFTYYDIETIQTTLKEKNITVTTPTAITDHTIPQYCTYFENGLPQTVQYCTTTAVLDSQGKNLGNINMGGDTNSPILAIANIETKSLESNQEDVIAVVETMIETLVCDCWEEVKSDDDLESISVWVEHAQKFYTDSDERGITSQVDDLGTVTVSLEITPKENSVLQTLVILK